MVEDQAFAATMRLTDLVEEQAILEAMLEETKPGLPPEVVGYDFLIATPFRYRPHHRGSRFRRANEIDGVFYAAEHVETCAAELTFIASCFSWKRQWPKGPWRRWRIRPFQVRVKSNRAIDLTIKPFVAGHAGMDAPDRLSALPGSS